MSSMHYHLSSGRSPGGGPPLPLPPAHPKLETCSRYHVQHEDMADSKPKTLNPPSVPKPPPTYDQVAVTPLLPQSKLVTLAGQVGIDPVSGEVPADFSRQVRLAYDSIENALAAVGATPRDIVHVRHYIVTVTGDAALDSKDVVDRGWGKLWIEFMDQKAGGHRPPDTVLGVAGLAKKALLYEVEAWAVVAPACASPCPLQHCILYTSSLPPESCAAS